MIQEVEVWVPFTGNNKYHLSSHGRVKSFYVRRYSIVKHKFIGLNPRSDGYVTVHLKTDNQVDYLKPTPIHFVHKLIATHFIPNTHNKPEVNHKDGDKANNAVSNLEWVTHQENITHSFRILGRKAPSGQDHYAYGIKLSKERKKLMSIAKLGEKHPKFKGYYLHNETRYPSSISAALATGQNNRSIIRWAQTNKYGWSFLNKEKTVVTDNTVEWVKV